MNEDGEMITQTVPVTCADKTQGPNLFFLTDRAAIPLVIIRDLRLYYSPTDVCNFLQPVCEHCNHVMLLLSSISPTFVLLMSTRTIEDARLLVERLRLHPNAISSMDTLTFDYVHSYSIGSRFLSHTIDKFLFKTFLDTNCAICLNPCSEEYYLFTLPCGHTLHTHCESRMQQWECPVCRYVPISALDVACCEVCGSFDRPFVCLRCARSFCYDHCLSHYQQTGHAYCASADGRETWNLMSGSSMKRIAIDKSGEFVELCAKDDLLRGYLEAALVEQIKIHKSLGKQKMKHEELKYIDEKNDLIHKIEETKRRIAEKKEKIAQRANREKRRTVAKSIFQGLQQRLENLPEENASLTKRNSELQKEIAEQAELVKDMEGTACIAAAATLKGKNEEVHIKFGSPK